MRIGVPKEIKMHKYRALARRLDVQMPITFALDALLNRGARLDDAIAGVLRSAAR